MRNVLCKIILKWLRSQKYFKTNTSFFEIYLQHNTLEVKSTDRNLWVIFQLGSAPEKTSSQ